MKVRKHLGRRFAVAVIGAAITASFGIGSAQAGVVKSGINIGAIGGTKVVQLQRYYTPTANLDKVANALSFKNKSVTTLIAAPAGLGVTHPVDISVSYDNSYFLTQGYSNSGGNHFLYNFPAGLGQALYKGITVTLVEHVTATQTQTFRIQWQPLIEPLYDIRVSPLTFHLDNGCDWIGSSEPVVEWNDPKGVYGQTELDQDGGDTATINAFARTYYEVGQSAGLKTPSVIWYEDDYFSVGAVPPAQNGHLLPGASFTYSLDTQEATGQDCTGRLTYSVTDTLRWYPYL